MCKSGVHGINFYFINAIHVFVIREIREDFLIEGETKKNNIFFPEHFNCHDNIILLVRVLRATLIEF